MIEDRLILDAVRRLLEGFRPQRIILFGSQARGTADSRSDVALLVVCSIQGSGRALHLARPGLNSWLSCLLSQWTENLFQADLGGPNIHILEQRPALQVFC